MASKQVVDGAPGDDGRDLAGYGELLEELKSRIHAARIRASVAVNRELVLVYWQIGRDILTRQERAGWGSKVVERPASDLRRELPSVRGLSRTNLSYLRAFAQAYPDEQFVQQAVGRIPWGYNTVFLDRLASQEARAWYARQTIELGWSRNVLVHQIDGDEPSIGLILCRERNRVIVEYALRTTRHPIGVAEYHVTEQLPEQLRGSIPTAEGLEREMGGSQPLEERG